MKWSHVAVLTPAFYISRIFGVAPLLVRRNQDGTLQFVNHRALLVIPLLNVISMLYVAVDLVTSYLPRVIKHHPSYVPYVSCMVLSCYSGIVVLGIAIFNQRHTVRAFNEVYKLSRHLLEQFDYSRLPLEAMFAPTAVILTTLRYLLQVSGFNVSAVLISGYHNSYMVHLSSQILATCFLFYIENFFKCLNNELSEIKLDLISIKTDIQTWLILRRLKRLRKLHNRICDLCDLVCERFSLDIFISFSVIIFLLLSTLYAGLWTHDITHMSLLNTLNVTHYGFLILRLAHVCYRSDCVMKQSVIINAKVCSLMTSYLPAEIKQEIYHFTLQTMLRKVEITACGFYGLKMETVTTLIYLVTTYLVMVINLFEVV